MVKYRRMTEQERDECVSLYLEWETLDALAERYNRARETIRRLIKRRGANRGRWIDPNPNYQCLAQRRHRAKRAAERALASAP